MSKSLSLEVVIPISQSEIVSVQISLLITLCLGPVLADTHVMGEGHFKYEQRV